MQGVAAMRDLTHHVEHAKTCKRPAPLLRLSWRGTPELWCPSCGRTCPAPDTRSDDRAGVPR